MRPPTSNTAFMWLVIKLLEPSGEMVAIIPRSFCNGPCFRPFCKALFSSMTVKRVHVYESRKKTFQDDDVLQENIIIHAIKEEVFSSSVGPDNEYVTMRERLTLISLYAPMILILLSI